MKSARLPWLLAVMTVLILVRWLDWPAPPEDQTPVAAIVRTPATVATPTKTTSERIAPRLTATTSSADVEDSPGNAFLVRSAAEPPPVIPAPVAQVSRPPPPPPPPAAAPATPAVPRAPLQVIGTWNDGGQAPAAFVAGPQGVWLARPGVVLLAEYRVTQVSARHVTLEHLVSKQVQQLPIPAPSSSPRRTTN